MIPKIPTPIIVIEGIKTRMKVVDIDKDGVVGGIETVNQQLNTVGETEFVERSELEGVMKEFDRDELNAEGMSSIDFNARIHPVEEPIITAWETMVSCGIVPHRWSVLTRKKKRNSVSIGGLGRKEKVEVVVGKREHDAQQGGFSLMQTAKNLFTGGNKPQ